MAKHPKSLHQSVRSLRNLAGEETRVLNLYKAKLEQQIQKTLGFSLDEDKQFMQEFGNGLQVTQQIVEVLLEISNLVSKIEPEQEKIDDARKYIEKAKIARVDIKEFLSGLQTLLDEFENKDNENFENQKAQIEVLQQQIDALIAERLSRTPEMDKETAHFYLNLGYNARNIIEINSFVDKNQPVPRYDFIIESLSAIKAELD